MTSKLTGEGAEAAEGEVKKSIAIFAYKQRLLSIEMTRPNRIRFNGPDQYS